MIFIDTGYFIALFDRGDQLHERAVRWTGALSEPLLVSEYVLLETINHFSRQAVRARGHDIATTVLTDPMYEFEPASRSLFDAGMEAHRRAADKDWSLTDCISFYLMRKRKITRALAFDRHFEQAGFEALLRRDP